MKNRCSNILLLFILFSCNSKYPLELGGGYKLDYDGNSDIYIIDNQNTIVVFPNIISFAYDSKFIIAEQKPRMSNNAINKSLKEQDQEYSKILVRNYFIINKNDRKVYGPLNKKVYQELKDNLRVPKQLKLK